MARKVWCRGNAVEVSPTGNAGEWRIHRSSASDDCTCLDPFPDPYYGAFNYMLGNLRLKVNNPGRWRVDVAAGSATPFCECEQGCFTDLSYFGGTLTVPRP